ncbi:MAG: hypothetical protein IT203_02725 [Fimbriimonadaceae bacterium]|nr:hypothetical protein [Fimbriimonadaceae bacterium]
MNRFTTAEQVEAYFAGLREGIEIGATLNPSEYCHDVHDRKLAALARAERSRVDSLALLERTEGAA